MLYWLPQMWGMGCAVEPYVVWYGWLANSDGIRLVAQVRPRREFEGGGDAPFRYSFDGKGGHPGFPANSVDEAQTFVRWHFEDDLDILADNDGAAKGGA